MKTIKNMKILIGAGVAVIIAVVLVLTVGCGVPTMTVTTPEDGDTVTASQIYVKGKISDGKAAITVNGKNAWKNMKTGEFQSQITLVEGENRIEVKATSGKTVVTKTLTVNYTPEAEPVVMEIR